MGVFLRKGFRRGGSEFVVVAGDGLQWHGGGER
jgi:hypothetical protein